MSIIIFFIVLFILVLVHEWGHFIVAKKTGMRVDEFGIGFPPKLFGIKKGETEYTFNALPLGGFVKIWGENGEEPFSPVESEANDRRSEALAEAGEGGTKVVNLQKAEPFSPVESEANDRRSEASAEAVDYSRSFSSRPKWAQALVLVAGITMNILFAWFLFSITYMVGVPTQVSEIDSTDKAQLYVSEVMKDSPASVIPSGSVITEVQFGEKVVVSPTPSEFSSVVAEAASREMQVTYSYKDDIDTALITPVAGLVSSDPTKYIVGASLTLVEVKNKPFFSAIWEGMITTVEGLKAITSGLMSLIGQSFTGKADFSQVAGPVGIVGMVGEAASFGFTTLLTFTAIISLNLAVINLLPFPALDGGRLVFVAIEAVTRKQIPVVWAGRVNLIGFAILMLLMIAVTYNDIVRLL